MECITEPSVKQLKGPVKMLHSEESLVECLSQVLLSDFFTMHITDSRRFENSCDVMEILHPSLEIGIEDSVEVPGHRLVTKAIARFNH